MDNNKLKIIGSILSGLIAFVLYLSNASSSLGFADAAEFALVTKIASVAHPPGFPAYVLTGHLFSKIASFFSSSHVMNMIIFSALCSAVASVLIYQSVFHLISRTGSITLHSLQNASSSFVASMSFAIGATVWHWSNSVEVYALHALACTMVLYGLVRFGENNKILPSVVAGAGIGIGIANHHLTMIMLLPFLLVAITGPFFPYNSKKEKKKKEVTTPVKWFYSRSFLVMTLTAVVVSFGFYAWLYLRASADLPFKFGNPDNAERMFYHLAGGAWIKNTATSVEGLASLRFPYFMNLTFEQYLLFLPFLLVGIIWLTGKKSYRLLLLSVGYYIALLLYQLRIDQTADTDAYMIPAFVFLAIPAGFGTAVALRWKKEILYLIPVLTILQVYLNFHKSDKRNFNASKSLMAMLDESAPKNAVILISDWTLVSQYHYYRIAENFRPDLTVLNYDLKFTNYKIVPKLYPGFYKEIGKSYDEFIQKLGVAHPQEIYNTGCTLDTPELMGSYKNTIKTIQDYTHSNNTAFMVDPKAFVFMMQNNLMTGNSYVSGCFVSSVPTGLGLSFLKLPFEWLNAPRLLREPAATDKIVDFEAMLDFHRNYYRSAGDSLHLQEAENSYNRIKSLQRKLKVHMPFVYRPKK